MIDGDVNGNAEKWLLPNLLLLYFTYCISFIKSRNTHTHSTRWRSNKTYKKFLLQSYIVRQLLEIKGINSSFVKPFVKNYTPQMLIIQYYTNERRLEMCARVCTVQSCVRPDGGTHVVNSTAQININKTAFYLSWKSGIFGRIFIEGHLDVACGRHGL